MIAQIKMKGAVLGLLALGIHLGLSAQETPEKILFTVDATDVVTDREFEAVFNKNREIGEQLDPKTPSEYLDLYVNFKLKVHEAKVLDLDQRESFIREFNGYRAQLAKPYLTDRGFEEALVDEAYARGGFDVRAGHIMKALDANATPADTATAYKAMQSLRSAILKGEKTFEEAAKASDDTYSAQRGGDLGYFTVFNMVYPFENAAYTLAVGSISQPIRTQFGYHLVKVYDRREARGRIKVAHLMRISNAESKPEEAAAAERQIREIYASLVQGTDSWENLCRQYSEDKTTKDKGGELPEFGINAMTPEFEEVAFALQQPGDYSEPFQTAYGWHIVRLVERVPRSSLDQSKNEIKARIQRDQRALAGQEQFVARLLKEYKYKRNEANYKAFVKQISPKTLADGTWKPTEAQRKNTKVLGTFADRNLKTSEFAIYLETHLKPLAEGRTATAELEAHFQSFVESELIAYEDAHLEQKHPEFRWLVNEYREGILLFDLTDEKVWTRSISDTAGLEAFFDRHKSQYQWPLRYRYERIDCKTEKMAKKARKALSKGESIEAVQEKFNEESGLNLLYSSMMDEGKNEPLLASFNGVPGLGPVVASNGQWSFVRLLEVVPPTGKTLDEVRGLAASEYQKELEQEWINELKAKYLVVVDTEVRDALFARLQR